MGRKIQSIGKYKFCYETLGKGSFARVELVYHEITKCKVVMKIINTRKITEDYVRNNLYREARILSQLHHPNIITFYESVKADMYYCLVTECAEGGELSKYMRTFAYRRFPEDVARHYLRQLVSAVQYIHERQVVHRDLKMENLMLDKTKKHLKLVDFGLSNNLPSTTCLLSTHCGSPEYAAPELFTTGAVYGPEVDIWSMGIVFYTCLTGNLPFFSPYYDHSRKQRLLNQINRGLDVQHMKEMAHLTKDCQNLMIEMLEPLPHLRIPIDDVTSQAWITEQGTRPFTPYFTQPKHKEIRLQIIEQLSILTNLEKIEVERFVHENGTNELSAMYKMMMQEAKVETGFYDEDHTSRPAHLVNERKRHLAQAKWKRIRCRLKESAKVFREMVYDRTSTNRLSAAELQSIEMKEEAITSNSEQKKQKEMQRIKQRVNPVGIVKTEKKEFFPPQRNNLQMILQQQSTETHPSKVSLRSHQLKQSNRTFEQNDEDGRPSTEVARAQQAKAAKSKQSRDSLVLDITKQLLSITECKKQRSHSTTGLSNNPTATVANEKSKTVVRKSRPVSEMVKVTRSGAERIKPSRSTIRLQYHHRIASLERKKYAATLPVAPLANIDETNLGNTEVCGTFDEYAPRQCLAKVTDGEMSSGVLLSSTISEMSDAVRSFDSVNFDGSHNTTNDLYDGDSNQALNKMDMRQKVNTAADLTAPTVVRTTNNIDNQLLCNGRPSNMKENIP